MKITCLSSYDYDWAFSVPWTRLISEIGTIITACVCKDRGIDLVLQVSAQGYQAIERNCSSLFDYCSVQKIPFNLFREALGYSEFYAYPKFIGLSLAKTAILYRDLDVIVFDVEWLLKNPFIGYFSTYEYKVQHPKEHILSQEVGDVCVDGALFYVENARKARMLGRELAFLCSCQTRRKYLLQEKDTDLPVFEEAIISNLYYGQWEEVHRDSAMYVNYREKDRKKQKDILEQIKARCPQKAYKLVCSKIEEYERSLEL